MRYQVGLYLLRGLVYRMNQFHSYSFIPVSLFLIYVHDNHVSIIESFVVITLGSRSIDSVGSEISFFFFFLLYFVIYRTDTHNRVLVVAMCRRRLLTMCFFFLQIGLKNSCDKFLSTLA